MNSNRVIQIVKDQYSSFFFHYVKSYYVLVCFIQNCLAVAHSILVIAYHMIIRKEPYHELGGDYFDKRRPEATAKRLVRRLEQLGFQVSLEQLMVPVSS